LKTVKQLIVVATSGIIASLVATFLLVIWRQFNPTNLLFDQFCIISAILVGLSFLLNRSNLSRGTANKSMESSIAIAVTTSLLYFSTVQYTVLAIDRSRSFYVLSWVDQGWFNYSQNSLRLTSKSNPQGIDLDKNNLEPIEQRIEEQISRKLIKIDGNEIHLTFFGKTTLIISEKTALIFNLKNWQANTGSQ
jgi:hypothetical protein